MRPARPARPHAPRTLRRAGAVLAATALVLAACGTSEDATGTATGGDAVDAPAPAPAPEPDAAEPLTIVATTSIIGDVVVQLVGDDATVRVLMAPGVDPHGYQASAADAAALRDADLVVANGLLLEEGLVSALEAASEDGVRVLTLADKVDPIAFEDGHDDHGDHGDEDDHDDHGDADDHDDHDDHGDDHDDHDHGDEDPHFWFDPLRMADAVDIIATDLATLRSDVDWAARAAELRSELEGVDAEMAALFATIPADRRLLVTNHDALGYLEARYGLEVVGTVVPGASTTVETNPRAFADLVDLLVAEGIDVIFAETTDTTTLAEQLASEVIDRGDLDVQVVQLSTGALGEPGSGAETYLGLLRTTARAITDALA